MIDLDATGAVYRGHVLSRIVESFQDGWVEGDYPSTPGWDKPTWIAPPVSTRGWARLDCRVIGNPWGLSVSEDDADGNEGPNEGPMDDEWINRAYQRGAQTNER